MVHLERTRHWENPLALLVSGRMLSEEDVSFVAGEAGEEIGKTMEVYFKAHEGETAHHKYTTR